MAGDNNKMLLIVLGGLGVLLCCISASLFLWWWLSQPTGASSSSSSPAASSSSTNPDPVCASDTSGSPVSWGSCSNCILSTTESPCYNCPVGDQYWGRWNYPNNTSCCDYNMQNCNTNLGPNCTRAQAYADTTRHVFGTLPQGGSYNMNAKFNSTKDLCFDCPMADPSNTANTIYGRTKGNNCCDSTMSLCYWKKK